MEDPRFHARRFEALVEADPTLPAWGREILLLTYEEIHNSRSRQRLVRAVVESDPKLDARGRRLLANFHSQLVDGEEG